MRRRPAARPVCRQCNHADSDNRALLNSLLQWTNWLSCLLGNRRVLYKSVSQTVSATSKTGHATVYYEIGHSKRSGENMTGKTMTAQTDGIHRLLQ